MQSFINVITVMKRDNQKYCVECGAIINIKAELCPNCGVRQRGINMTEISDEKNRWIITVLLCWFLGIFGAHRFYTNHILIGIIQLITLGGCGIWAFIDLIIILTGNFKDSQGNPIRNA